MNRIDLIASLCNNSEVICDIGCDHAQVIVKAIKNYGVKFGYACDISEGPLKQAAINICNHNLKDKVKMILSDGFDNVNDEFDTAILAGMGGILISNILSKGLDKIKNKKLIIEANSDVPMVREFLFNNNFIITDEYAIYDANKYYEIIVAETGNAIYDEHDINFGPILRRKKPEAFIKYYEALIDHYSNIISKISNIETRKEKEKIFENIVEILALGVCEKHIIEGSKNYYKTYFIDDEARPTIFVSAGGGYAYTSPRESGPVAKIFNELGYHVIVINYREDLTEFYPIPQQFFASIVNKYKNDSRVKNVIGLGFSAGGHNLLEVALHKDMYGDLFDLIILSYPVVSSNNSIWHKGSYEYLLGDKITDDKMLYRLSLEYEVTADAPKMFVWSTFEDKSVNVLNTITLASVYKMNGVECELHVFPYGAHGFSVANKYSAEGMDGKVDPYISRWVDLAHEWIKKNIN